jgi:hypothetical protein
MMQKATGATLVGAASLLALAVACGSSDSASNAPCAPEGTAGDSNQAQGGEGQGNGEAVNGGGDGGQNEGGAANPTGGSVPATPRDFTPSNLPDDLDLEVEGDLILNGETCASEARINTDTGEINCYDPGQVEFKGYRAFQIVKQADGSEVGVFSGKNIVLENTVRVIVEGQRPLVLLTPGNVQLGGRLQAVADEVYAERGNAGGFSSVKGEQVKGQGPGGGGGTSPEAGGGSYCGKGGKGGSATGAAGGVVYGAEELVPLLGGSSGGNGALGGSGGAGGGAIQIVAGGKLAISATGVIHVGGAGGGWNGGGGGSGGAILLEASELDIAGTLAANGGGGGEGDGVAGKSGLNASPDAIAAPGGATGTAELTDDGGSGSAAGDVDGSSGSSVSGGGGGGAGRIRLNSKSGKAKLSGELSPAAGSACVTEGTLD